MGTAYSPVGPWTNNAAPYLSAAMFNALETFLSSLNSATYDSNITSDQSGNLTIPSTGHYEIAGFQVLWSPSSADLYLNVPNSGGSRKLYIQVGGVNKASLDSSGNWRTAGTQTASVTP